MKLMHIILSVVFLLLPIDSVYGDEDNSVCHFENDGDLADQLNAKPFYIKLRPFPKKVFDAIPSEGFFHKLFNVSFPPKEVKKTFLDNCINYSVNMGLNCPVQLCKGVAATANKAFKKGLTELQYFSVVANTLENSLKEEGLLYDNSQDDLIKTFLKNVASFLYSDDAKGAKGALFALNDGAMKFFRGLGVTCLKDVSYVAQEFGAQLGKAAASESSSSTSEEEMSYSEVEVFTYTETYFTEYETEYFTFESS